MSAYPMARRRGWWRVRQCEICGTEFDFSVNPGIKTRKKTCRPECAARLRRRQTAGCGRRRTEAAGT